MSDILRDFDKKNEFPKVKLNLPKFDFSRLTEAETNMATIFDNIAKDIRERQDNAMAMEFTKCIGELLRNNGVVPKMTEYTRNFETDNTFETRYGVSIDELDFSEHDKVFLDKIAKLEKQIKSYEAERKELRTRCCMDSAREKFDNHSYGGLVIYTKNFTSECERRLYDENQELKQRIAELEQSRSEWINTAVEWQQKCEKLESKETEKQKKRTGVIIAKEINGQTYVTLDDFMRVVNDLQEQNRLEDDGK